MKRLTSLLSAKLKNVLCPDNGPTLDRHWTDNGPCKFIAILCLLFTLSIGNAWGVSNGDTFVQITSVSDLSNGDEVIIVNQDETYTLSSTDAGNYRARVSISTSSHSYTYSSSDGVQVLKVKIDGDYIGFHTGSGFLQVPSNNNYLSTSSALYTASLTDNSRWSLTVNDVNASGDYVCWLEVKKTWTSSGKTVYRYLQYNSGDSRFASYKDTQEDCLIYKKTAASCGVPTALTKGSISLSSQTVSWTAPASAPSGGYYVAYSTATSSDPGNDVYSTDGNYTVMSVAAGTTTANIPCNTAGTYNWWVRSKCSTSDNSSCSGWVKGTAFTMSTLYLKTNSTWRADNAYFAAYFWDATTNGWTPAMSSQTDCETGVYKVVFPAAYTSMKFVRLNPAYSTPSFETGHVWNETGNLTIPANKDCFTLPDGAGSGTGNGDGNANWSVYTRKYQIDFNLNKGGETFTTEPATAPAARCVASGSTTSAPTNPQAMGWEITGWYKESGKTHEWVFASQTVSEDQTLYAKWEEVADKTIYLDASKVISDGKKWDAEDVVLFAHAYIDGTDLATDVKMTAALSSCDDHVYAFDIPGNADYVTFARCAKGATSIIWSGGSANVYNQFSLAVEENKDWYYVDGWTAGTLKSTEFSPTSYTMSFATGSTTYTGGNVISGSKSNENKACDVDYTLPSSAVFSTTGYTQDGWATSDGGSKAYNLGDDYTSNAAQAFYPHWSLNSHTLTWAFAGGESSLTPGTHYTAGGLVNYGAGITYPTNVSMSRTGYDFSSWSSDATTMPDNDLTITASWTIHTHKVSVASVSNATITATPAGGSAIAEGNNNGSVNYGTTVTLNWPTPDTHYSNITWDVYKDGDSSTKVEVSGSGNGATFTLPDYDVIVSATAVEDAYKTVVFMNSGVEKQSGKVYVGERPSAPTLTDGTAHDACDATSDKHYGWTQDTWSGTIATQASMDEDYTVYAKGSNLPIVAAGDAATITYNAVWAKAEAGSEAESITAFEDGDYFIVDTRAEVADHFFALNGGVTSNAIAVTDISSAVTENALEGTITLDLTDDVLVDAMKYRLTTVGDSITIKHISTDTKVSQMLTDTKFETTGNRNWTIEKHATDNRFTIQSWFTKSGTKTSCLLMQYSSWNSGAQQQDLTLTAKPYNSANMGGTAAKGQNYMSGYVYLVPAGGTSYSTFLISCCDKNVTLATNSPAHGSITFSPSGTISTCGADAATRQTTMTVTPDAGYYLSAWSTTGVTPASVSPAIAYGSVSNSGAQATTVTFTQNTTTGTYTANATFSAIPVSTLSLRAQQTGQSDKVGNDLTMNCYPKEGQTGGNDPLNHTLKVLFEEVLPANALDKTYDWSVRVKATGDADWTAVGFTGNALNTNSIIHTYNKSTGTLIIKATEGTAEIKITAHDGSGVNAKVTITVANVPMSSVSVSPTEMEVYAGQKKPVTVTFTPANATDRSYSAGSSYTYVNIQNKGASSFNIEGKTSVTDVNHDETVTVTTTDGSKTATVDVTVKPLPKVMFVDNVHNESFANVIATVDEGGLTVTTTKSTPTHSDVSDPGASYNTCERQHLHLLGWIESTWADAHPNAEPGDITGAGAGNYYAAGADIDLVTQNNKTFYAVWTKIE